MKKILLTLVCILALVSLTNCKKTIEHHYVGAYINIMNLSTKKLNDANLKIYYNMEDDIVSDINNIVEYRATTESFYNDVNLTGDNRHTTLSVVYQIIDINNQLKEVEIYPIIYKEGNYIIDDSDVYTITLKNEEFKKITIEKNYKFDKINYQFATTIKILKKES